MNKKYGANEIDADVTIGLRKLKAEYAKYARPMRTATMTEVLQPELAVTQAEVIDVIRLFEHAGAECPRSYSQEALFKAKVLLQNAQLYGLPTQTLLVLLKQCKQEYAPQFTLLSEVPLPMTGLDFD